MQYQLAMVKGSEKAQDILAGKDEPDAPEGEVPNPAAWAWKMMAEASRGGAAAMKAASGEAPKPSPKGPKRRKKSA
jgi:hypothetical protein